MNPTARAKRMAKKAETRAKLDLRAKRNLHRRHDRLYARNQQLKARGLPPVGLTKLPCEGPHV